MIVKILGIPYTIEEVENIPNTVDCIGLHIGAEQKIQIKKSLPKEMKEQTILHEIMHAIFWILGENELSENERVVQSLAMAFYQLVKDNGEISLFT